MSKKSKDGYILLHRQIRKNLLWGDKPFSKGQAWIDMLMMANHEPNQVLLGSKIVDLDRGQFIRAERSIGKSWGWGRSKIRSFFKLLENQTMIRTKVEPKGTIISIINYDEYQLPLKKPNQSRTKQRTTTEPRPNQENKCIMNVRKNIIRFVQLEQKKYDLLCKEFGQPVIDKKILDMEFYIENNKKGKSPYVNYNMAIRKWLERDGIQPKVQSERIACASCGQQLSENDIRPDGSCPVCTGKVSYG